MQNRLFEPLSGGAVINGLDPQTDQVNPHVSVVIATFNMGAFVAQAVESVLKQTGIDYEIEVLVVDDGSTDNTLEQLAPFNTDDRVHIIRQSNQGQPRAKNVGIQAAKGTYIAFCDADDYWLPNKLSIQIPLFEKNPKVGVVCSPTYMLHGDNNLKHQTGRKFYRGRVLNQLFKKNIVPFGTAIVRRRCLEDLGGFDEALKMGIDWELWLRLSVHWEFDYVDEPTYVYRIWDGQMSKNWQGRYDHALRIMSDFLNKHPNLLSSREVKTAYADTYTNLAAQQLNNEGIKSSLPAIVSAFTCRWTYWPAWRLILFLPLKFIQKRLFS